ENAAREVARSIVLRDPDSVDDDVFGDASENDGPPPVGMVIAETEHEIRTITVGRAVLELDMTGYPVVLFRNAAHGGLSVVYRRPDGNVGWIDP
ncbi:sigma 54 modulation/S30EA ribosomal C-terminal domain-containing protein, partial [Escherichia coli]|nr:sigma 54 modulation/S30EA ribosomal C-terminal domain-containing protein [Escherichia coli]